MQGRIRRNHLSKEQQFQVPQEYHRYDFSNNDTADGNGHRLADDYQRDEFVNNGRLLNDAFVDNGQLNNDQHRLHENMDNHENPSETRQTRIRKSPERFGNWVYPK